jgi:Rrf2 family transcriptional regulator, nitric oxide-sensitive transcriptional repressor
MHLTQFSDIGFRLLMYLAQERREVPAITLAEVSSQFAIPRNHLVKVAGKLIKNGWVSAIRGRSGGLRLAVEPSDINIGQVLRVLEGHVEVINCEKLECRLKSGCELKQALNKAYAAFFNVLDQLTLADMTQGLVKAQIINMQKSFITLYLDKAAIH